MKKILMIILLFLSCNQKGETVIDINLDTAYVMIDGYKVHLKIEQEVDKNYLNHKYLVHTKLWAVRDTTTLVGAQLQEWNMVFTPRNKLLSAKKSEYDKVYADAIKILKNQ